MKKDDLDISKYPQSYQKYLTKEKELAIDFLRNSNKVLDIGCGSGRIIPFIANQVKKYVGIDINDEYLKQASEISNNFKNTKIIRLNAEELSKKFKGDEFDKSICLWNTIGCLKNNDSSLDNERKIINQISKVTKEGLFFTVLAKGNLEKRKEYYENFRIKYLIDKGTEIFFSEEWGVSKAYSKEDIINLVKGTSFKISKIELVENFAFAVYLSKYQ